MRAITLGLALLLTACSVAPNGQPPQAMGLTPDAGGLQPVGTDLRIDFGRAQAGVIDSVSDLLGTPPQDVTTNDECGAGPVTAAYWPVGLTVNFLDGDFRGWVVTEPDLPVAGGLTVGMTPPVGPLVGTTLGQEVEIDGIWALVEDAGTITTLWSGTTCFFR